MASHARPVAEEAMGDDNAVPWQLFASDLKLSKMKIKRQRPCLRFEIPIPTKAPRYIRGTIPRPRLDWVLADDSDAFIVDKVILPREPFVEPGDPRQRRAYYIIGWPDLPAVRPVVDCAKALDYVSPRTMEDWEYKDLLRREEEKARARREAEEAAALAAKGKGVARSEYLPNGKKRPGRKPKKARLMNARLPTPQLDSEQEAMLPKRRPGPSLSTPQKSSKIALIDAEMAMLDSMEDSMAEDIEDQIQRQLMTETSVDVAARTDMYWQDSDPLGFLQPGDVAFQSESTSRASSVRPSPPAHLPTRNASSIPRSSVPAPAVRPSLAAAPTRGTPYNQAAARPSSLQPQRPVSTASIPLPTRSSFGSRSAPSSSAAQISNKNALAGRPKNSTPRLQASPSAASASRSSQEAVDDPSTAEGNGGFTPTNSFTPMGGRFPRPPKRPAEDSALEAYDAADTPSSTQSKKGRKKQTKMTHPPSEPTGTKVRAGDVEETQPPQDYVVKRLEGHEVIDGVDWFKVRWEGNWPPDQNPTWEPEECISADLVKRYMKREAEKKKSMPTKSKTGGGGGGTSSSYTSRKKQTTLSLWAQRYASVADAFEGEDELSATNNAGVDQGAEAVEDGAGDDEMNRERLVVDDDVDAEQREKAAAERRKTLAAQLASMTPGSRSGF